VFAFTDTRAPVEVAFTDRRGAVAGGPSASLDLAEPAAEPGADGSDAADVESRLAALEENLDAVGHALARGGPPAGDYPFALPPGSALPTMVRMRQVHGNDVAVVDRAWLDARPAEPPRVDALVTDVPGVALVVRVADCVPLLLADPGRGVIGAVHAGRPGLVAGVVPAAVGAMRDLGAEELVAWIGPHICGRCYEVPDAMRADVAAVVPEAFAETSWGTPAVDVGAGVVAQLRTAGAEVLDAATCTREDERLFSHRRHESGRLAGLVWVRP
jgi:YfiH family protein